MDHEPHIEGSDPLAADEQLALRRKLPRTGNRAIDALQAEIETTREEAIQTINELEWRLSYTRLKAKVKDQAREATIGRMNDMAKNTTKTSKRWGRNMVATLKDNPLPALMIGGGVAWMIANRSSAAEAGRDEGERPQYYDRRKADGVDQSGTYGIGFIDRRRTVVERPESTGHAATRGAQVKEDLRRKTREAREKAAESGEHVRRKAAHAGEQVKHKARQVGSDVADHAGEAGRRVARRSRSAGRGLIDMVENNPIAAAGIVLTAGALVGATLPSSRYEDETMGEARDRLVDRARETGREQVEKAEAVVEEAKEAAKTEAEAQGLIDREKADEAERKAKEKAREMAKAGEEKVKSGIQSMKGDESRGPR